MLVIKNCRFIPELTDDWKNETGDIAIEGDEIRAIEKSFSSSNYDVTVIDAKGNTVLPGLFDLHVHLDLSGGDVLVENKESDSYRVLKALKFAQRTLEAGFTTLRDVGARNHIDIALRNAIQDGLAWGPRLIVAGKIITPTEAGNDYFFGLYQEADGPEEIRKASREQIKAGANFLKYMGTGAIMNPGGQPGTAIYDLEEVKAIVQVAEQHHTFVASHCHGNEGIKNAVQAGVRTIEHGSLINDECIELLKTSNRSFLVPTLSVIKALHDNTSPGTIFMQEKTDHIFQQALESISKAYQAGLKLGFGTDQGTCFSYHGDNADEFVCRQELIGMKPLDILLQATRYSAEILGMQDQLGSIGVGKKADLIFVAENPLKDIKRMVNSKKMVVLDGKVIKNELN